ncbi:MAG TPA: helix-turn-helix domain-containing protein [Longimicrobiaceae bacterium]
MSVVEGVPVQRRTAGRFGELLREWRRRRRYSQLALALEAGTSARHLSFLETGRARPSRAMVHRLAETLEIPARQRDALLLAAGFAPLGWNEDRAAALKSAKEAIGLVLRGLEPFPALAVDQRWTLLAANRTIEVLLRGAAPALLEPPVNVLRVSLHPEGLAPHIVNLEEWRAHVFRRLQREAEWSGDPVIADLIEELRAYRDPPSVSPSRPPEERRAEQWTELPQVAVPLRLATDRGILSLISTTTVFSTAVDAALAELTIESFLPGDEATRSALTKIFESEAG